MIFFSKIKKIQNKKYKINYLRKCILFQEKEKNIFRKPNIQEKYQMIQTMTMSLHFLQELKKMIIIEKIR
jgi:hypothetical protein